jgi:hypothetical protein
MSPFYVLNIQSTLSLVAFALIARWHVAPRLERLGREKQCLVWEVPLNTSSTPTRSRR